MKRKDLYFFICTILAFACYFAFFDYSTVDFNKEALLRLALGILFFFGCVIFLQVLLLVNAFPKPAIQDFIYSFTFLFSLLFVWLYINFTSSISYAAQYPEETNKSLGQIGMHISLKDPELKFLIGFLIPAVLQLAIIILRWRRRNKKTDLSS